MLFQVEWEFIDRSEDSQKRSLEVLGRWQPPEETDFQAFYGYADGTGDFAIAGSGAAFRGSSARWRQPPAPAGGPPHREPRRDPDLVHAPGRCRAAASAAREARAVTPVQSPPDAAGTLRS